MAIYFLNLEGHDFPSDFHPITIDYCLPSTISIGVSFLCFFLILLYNTFKPLHLWIKMKMEYFQVNENVVHMPVDNEDGDQEYREPLMNE